MCLMIVSIICLRSRLQCVITFICSVWWWQLYSVWRHMVALMALVCVLLPQICHLVPPKITYDRVWSHTITQAHQIRLQETRFTCLAFLHYVFSNVPLNELLERLHNHTGCIYLAFLHCVFSNDFWVKAIGLNISPCPPKQTRGETDSWVLLPATV